MLTRALLLLTAVVVIGAPLAGSDELVPSQLRDREDPAYWIAADKAVGPDGKLNRGAMGRLAHSVSGYLKRMQGRRANAHASPSSAAATRTAKWPELEGCESFFGTVPEHWKPTGSLSDFATHAEAIVTGRIVAIRQGFLGGMPGSLLRLEADYVKGEPSDETYLFYPLARIKTTEGLVCETPLGSFVPPTVGDRVLLFSMTRGSRLEGRDVFWVNTVRELVHESPRARLQLPASLTPFTSLATPCFDDIVGAVRTAVVAREQQDQQ